VHIYKDVCKHEQVNTETSKTLALK